MQNKEINDDALRHLMKESMVNMPFTDFEDRTMQRVFMEAELKASTANDRKLAHLFFVLGMVCGLIIAVLLSFGKLPAAGVPELVRTVSQVLTALFFTMLANRFLKFNRNRNR